MWDRGNGSRLRADARFAETARKSLVGRSTLDPVMVDPILLLAAAQGELEMKLETVARRVLAEFDEMPGLTLTPRQAARLFGLEPSFCRQVLDSLVDLAYLREHGGTIRRGDRIAA